MASVLAERMRLLAASLSNRGGGQFFSLGSSNRATAGVPEAAQRAMEELVYERALSHLHPTTASRLVTVCETCAMVRNNPAGRGSRQILTRSEIMSNFIASFRVLRTHIAHTPHSPSCRDPILYQDPDNHSTNDSRSDHCYSPPGFSRFLPIVRCTATWTSSGGRRSRSRQIQTKAPEPRVSQ